MELILVLVIGGPIVLAVWLIVRSANARDRAEELSRRLDHLEMELFRLKQEVAAAASDSAPAAPAVPRARAPCRRCPARPRRPR